MNSIYSYEDYRAYLGEVYASRKVATGFTWREFSKIAGYSSPVFLKLVTEGKANLSELGVERIGSALQLSGAEMRYFRALVTFCQATTDAQRREALLAMRQEAKSNQSHVVSADKYDFYSEWFHGALRELACNRDFQDDFRRLGEMLQPQVSAARVRKSLELLLRLGLLEKTVDGRYVQTSQHITTGSEVTSLAIRELHRQMANLAVRAIEEVPREMRDISGMTVGLSKAGFQRLTEELAAFRRKVAEIAAEDSAVNHVYRMNLQLFPLTTDLPEEER